jgi:hypothetical protein
MRPRRHRLVAYGWGALFDLIVLDAGSGATTAHDRIAGVGQHHKTSLWQHWHADKILNIESLSLNFNYLSSCRRRCSAQPANATTATQSKKKKQRKQPKKKKNSSSNSIITVLLNSRVLLRKKKTNPV